MGSNAHIPFREPVDELMALCHKLSFVEQAIA